MTTPPSKILETFPNPNPQRDYHIHMEIPEFTCLCPKTGQPDFATLLLDYIADEKCVELKSLKLYIWSFRNEGHFHEDAGKLVIILIYRLFMTARLVVKVYLLEDYLFYS